MSITGMLRRTDPAQLAWLLQDPVGNFEQMSGALEDDEGDEDGAWEAFVTDSRVFDLNKVWDETRAVLATLGDREPGRRAAGLAITGGTPTEGEIGYGPWRYLLAQEVQAVADALVDVSDASLYQAFLHTDMSTVCYGGQMPWDALLPEFLRPVCDLYAVAAQHRECMLQWLL